MISTEQYVDRIINYSERPHIGYYYPGYYDPHRLPGKYKKYPAYGYCEDTYTMKLDGSLQNYIQEYVPQDVDPLGAEHYIILGFKNAVVPEDIYIFETLNPGSVVRIWGRYDDCDWKLLWEGPPQICPEASRKFHLKIRKLTYAINIIRLEFNADHLRKYRTAIDAVLLKGYKPQKHWQKLRNLFQSSPGPTKIMFSKQVDVIESCDFVSRLPDEIILLIFQFLDLKSLSRCAQVSQTWNRVVQDPLLYRNISLKRYWHKINDGTVNYFKNRCKQLNKLDLSWCENESDKFVETFHEFLDGHDQLTHLSLCYCPFVTESTLHKISNYREITDLRLTHIKINNRNSCPFECLTKLNKLITLDLSHTNIEQMELIEILKTNPSLKHISIEFCSFLERVGRLASGVSTFNKNLRTWNSRLVMSYDEFKEPHFATCVNLEVLELGWCLHGGVHPGDVLEKVAVNCRNLQRLGISYWEQLDDTLLLPVVKYCKNLTHLDLSGNKYITSDICDKALISLPNLRLLDISFCPCISSQQVNTWQRDYPHLTIHHIDKTTYRAY